MPLMCIMIFFNTGEPITQQYVVNSDSKSVTGDVFVSVHWNVQGLLGKVDEVNLLNLKHTTDVLGICEHWLSFEELKDISIPGFYLASCYCRGS
ncbi:hypothetical protein J6590_102910 [Homalodisca vitripennis]|nr:hypothetical protein J6590_102910 [Homalodisca vitripennis]